MWWLLACVAPGPARIDDSSGLRFDVQLQLSSFSVENASTSQLGWGTPKDLWGLDAPAIQEVQLTGFHDLDGTDLGATIQEGTLSQASTWIQFFCLPSQSDCTLSDFQIFGHNFQVTDYYGDPADTWLWSLWADQQVVGLGLLSPGTATTALYTDAPSTLQFNNVKAGPSVSGSETVDWSARTEDVRGDPLDTPVDTAELLHLDTNEAGVPAALEGSNLSSVQSSIPVTGTSLHLADLGLPDGPTGDGTWVLVLLHTVGWLQIPAAVVVLA